MRRQTVIEGDLVDKTRLIMTREVGTCTDDSIGETYHLMASYGDLAPIVELPSGNMVLFTWSDLILAARDIEKKAKATNGNT